MIKNRSQTLQVAVVIVLSWLTYSNAAYGRKFDPAPDARYMAMGGSIVAGRGVVPQTKGYVYLLYESGVIHDIDNLSLTNAGAGGGVTTQVLLDFQLPLAVETVRPDVVTITIGINDLSAALSAPDPFAVVPGILARVMENLTTTFLRFCEELPDVRVYISNYYDLPPADAAFPGVSLIILQLNSVITGVAQDFGLPVADLYTAYAGRQGLLESESPGASPFSAHPTKRGHRVIAGVFEALIVSQDGRLTCPAG